MSVMKGLRVQSEGLGELLRPIGAFLDASRCAPSPSASPARARATGGELDSGQRAGVATLPPGEAVEGAVGLPGGQGDGCVEPACERGDVERRGVEPPDPAAGEIGEKVIAGVVAWESTAGCW